MPQGGQDWEGRHLLETDTVLTAGIDGPKSQCPSAGPTGDISPLSDGLYKSSETWCSSSSVFSWLFHCHWAGLGACPCEALCCPPPCCRLRLPAEPPSEASSLLDPGVFRSAQSAAARHALNRQTWSLSCSVQRQNAAFFLFQELKAGCRKSCWDPVVRLLRRASPVPHHTVLGGPFSTVTYQQVRWGLKAPTGIIHGVLNIFASCLNHLALARPSPIRTNPCVPQPLILWEDTDNLWIGLFLPPGSRGTQVIHGIGGNEMKSLNLLLDIEWFLLTFVRCPETWESITKNPFLAEVVLILWSVFLSPSL